MLSKVAAGVIVAGSLVAAVPAAQAQVPAELVTNGPQANPGDYSPGWAAQQNVRESRQYDRLIATSPGFRRARMEKECGPITDPQLRESCLASFTGEGDRYGSQEAQPMQPSYGASAPPMQQNEQGYSPSAATQPQPGPGYGYQAPPRPQPGYSQTQPMQPNEQGYSPSAATQPPTDPGYGYQAPPRPQPDYGQQIQPMR
jgi:hypothetical protein